MTRATDDASDSPRLRRGLREVLHARIEARLRAIRRRLPRLALTLLTRPRADVPLVRLGSDYGGWWVPEQYLNDSAVCYSIGVGEDISFDLELLARGCAVVAADPTPRAIAYLKAEGPTSARFRFFPVGIAGRKGVRRFYAPLDPAHVSHSISNLQGTSDFFDAECITVADLMLRAGHTQMTLLKLDIEGAEHEAIRAMLRSGRRPKALCVEFDDLALPRLVATLLRLRASGYSGAKIEQRNVTFVAT